MKAGKVQPVQIDDWDDSNAQGVRSLFADPGASEVSLEAQEADDGAQATQTRPLDEDLAREALRSAEVLRPLRLLPVGKEAKWTKQDTNFLSHARERSLLISYVEKPKSKGSAS